MTILGRSALGTVIVAAALGDKGRHARTTVGVAVLPGDAAVEVEGIFEVG